MPDVHLTFDDGPDPLWTPAVLDALAQCGVRATFFAVGRAARAHPGLVRRIVEAGHALGNHTWSHRHPWLLRRHEAVAEVLDGAHAIADVTGTPVRLFRPPHGRMRACMAEAAAAAGQRTLLWTRSAVDWGALATPAGIARRLARVRDGDIVLMHDAARGSNRPQSLLHVLPGFLWRLQQEGWHTTGVDASTC
ncbi:MAG: polysaccharide deacetylase family protein [Burkholderiales bacterium]|nr:polysaccharide deacetylase family protein [Burkholderiales bacterium]